MAVYHVSLKRLADARPKLTPADRPAPAPREPDAPAHQSPAPPEAGSPKTSAKPKRKTGKKAPRTAAKKRGATAPTNENNGGLTPLIADANLVEAVEKLLRLPRDKVDALLESCDEPTQRMMLALIYRLSTLEEELRDLSSRVRTAGARALQPATMRAAEPMPVPDGKDGLLEQVFQKNVSLRKGPKP